MKRLFTYSFVIFLLTLSACSSSPKVIKLSPKLKIRPIHLVDATSLYMEVRDKRNNNALGIGLSSLGNEYKVLSNDKLEVVVKSFLKASFEERGFVLVNNKSDSDTHLYVDVLQLYYIKNHNPTSARLMGTLIGNAYNKTGKFSDIFQEDKIIYQAKKQSDEAWVNESLEATLNMLAYSKALINFLDPKG